MHLPEEIARKIIDLNPYPKKGIIDLQVAERQFQVIVKGFNHLMQPENNFLYIGDEVGLGKTYIALGIASLLRLYSTNQELYTDTILVPKENLQYKWQKEIRNFIQHNYLRKDNIVKTVLDQPVGTLNENSIKRSLEVFVKNQPRYVIYRNSSFSIASENEVNDTGKWIEILTDKLPKEQQKIFRKIKTKFRKNHMLIKRAYAYLLNQSMPNIDLLIVDEAHNFRHGTKGDVSIRNQTVSRIFGANKEDEELLEAFPELLELQKPKIKKLLFLSATPINNSLLEIKNQLDCFLPKHRFSKVDHDEKGEEIINTALNEFMIRGVMTLEINKKKYSRNGYRHEHRKGNVDMKEDAGFQLMKDDSTALVLSLMQYKTIKELKLKSGNQFEMGMLAGFESFQKNTAAYEDDTLSNRKEREAQDEQVLKKLIESYTEKFNHYPLHPKQEGLVDVLFDQMIEGKKSLVFVRRIASVRELERKLFKKYSDHLIQKIEVVTKGTSNSSIKRLIQNYKDEFKREGIETTLDLLADRITSDLRPYYDNGNGEENAIDKDISKDLREIYYSLVDRMEIEKLRQGIKDHLGLKNIKKELKDIAINLIKRKWENNLVLDEGEDEDDENTLSDTIYDEEKAPYFFQRFFYNEGKKFKSRSYKKDWYELNLVLLNDRFKLFNLENKGALCRKYEFFEEPVDIKRFKAITDKTIEAIKRDSVSSFNNIYPEFRTNTFLTELLLNLCEDEFGQWIENHRTLIVDKYYTRFLNEIETLTELLKSIFRQGSGLIPAFITEAKTSKKADPGAAFIDEMNFLLTGEFGFVLDEIKRIIGDYQKLVERNFDDVNKIRYNLIQQLPVAGISGHHKKDVRKTAIQFRMPGYPYVLITTDILKEGEDLHSYCKNIYHYGIAWNPSDMEQRTGRIDRIDSLAYRSLKEVEGKQLESIPFNNKLQVFYPYLADTLEVNQMIRLFDGMDKFIEIFYNDLSTKIEKNSKADVDELVIDLPQQRKGLLKSKYEYDAFKPSVDGDALSIVPCIGTSFEGISTKMNIILTGLEDFEYITAPELDRERLILSGIMKVNNRQGPFQIYFKQTGLPGIFSVFMESVLGRIQVLGKTSNKEKVNELLIHAKKEEKFNFEIRESNSYVYITLTQDFSVSERIIAEVLYKLVETTDNIEKMVLGTDEKVEYS